MTRVKDRLLSSCMEGMSMGSASSESSSAFCQFTKNCKRCSEKCLAEHFRFPILHSKDGRVLSGRAYWAWSERFCATVCATPAVKCSPHLCRGDRRCPLLLNPAKSKLQKLRERLRLMSDEELVKFGKMVRGLTEPRVSVMPDTWKEQLQEARAEWRRRQPKAH